MNRYWNARIETKIAKNKNANEKEKRLFQIKITGINDQNSPFKIKTQRNDELFTKEFTDHFKSALSLDAHLEQHLKCAYHGRNKRISLYAIGCDTYTGLLILDENLYSLVPVHAKQPATAYRIELIASTVKYFTASDEDFKSLDPSQLPPITQSSNSNVSLSQIDLVINLDKRFMHSLTGDALVNYYQNLLLKCHLTWSYYFYEHQIKLQFKHLFIDYFTDADYTPRRSSPPSKKLFNIDPLAGKLQFKSLFDALVAKHRVDYLNQINVYSISSAYLNDTFIRLDGLATQSSYTCDPGQHASLVLLKDKFNQNETNRVKQFTATLEEANVLIDLVGINLGNRHRLNNITSCESNEFNWYFQVHSIQSSNEEQITSSELDDLNTASDLCLNRLIKLNSRVECNPKKEEISVIKEPTCGNGILEGNEQCDCGANEANCLNCCNMSSCRFHHKDYECSRGDCCDTAKCKLKSKKTMCRAAQSSANSTQTHTACDWAEFCDGVSSACPRDIFHHNGVACSEKNESGLCWEGKCVSSNLQCKTYWSLSASNSDKSCYSNFNTIGFENGNCGVTLNETRKVYKPCERVDAQCGLLQCQQGALEPLLKSESYFKATTSQRGQTYECKSITSQPSVHVQDGTQCDSGVCVSQKCVSLDDFLPKKCKKNNEICSNNGICDNEQTCHCFENWSGKHCDQFTFSTTRKHQIESFNSYSSLKTSSLVSIICGSTMLVFVLLFFLYLFLRRCRLFKPKPPKKTIKKSLSRSLIEFDNDYKVAKDFTDSSKKENIFSSFKKAKSDAVQTSTRVNSCASLHTNENSFILMNNDCSISLTKVNHAIQQLNSQPAKSILKKANETQAQEQNVSNLTDEVNSSIKFERQVNRNTLLNAAIGNGHRSSRRSLIYDPKRASLCSSSSSSSSISLSSSSSDSISSSLSKSNKSLNNKNTSSSESISSVVLKEPADATTTTTTSSKTDFLKVQDYLNELNLLSKQNQFTESARNSKEVSDSVSDTPSSPVKPITLLLTSYQSRLDDNKLIDTPQRPNSLLTSVFVNNNNNNSNKSNDRCVSSITSPTQMLHLHISKHQTFNYDETNLLTNSSETSSGYLSNSTTNLNQPLQKQQNAKQFANKLDVKMRKNSSRESLFNETDDYYSLEGNNNKIKQNKQAMNESNSSSSRSSALATPPPKLASPRDLTTKLDRPVDKRFSYILATASSNNLNVS